MVERHLLDDLRVRFFRKSPGETLGQLELFDIDLHSCLLTLSPFFALMIPSGTDLIDSRYDNRAFGLQLVSSKPILLRVDFLFFVVYTSVWIDVVLAEVTGPCFVLGSAICPLLPSWPFALPLDLVRAVILGWQPSINPATPFSSLFTVHRTVFVYHICVQDTYVKDVLLCLAIAIMICWFFSGFVFGNVFDQQQGPGSFVLRDVRLE